jgi:hypothetical protein
MLFAALAKSASSGALRHLDISDNSFNDNASTIDGLTGLLKQCENLEFFALSDNMISEPKYQKKVFEAMQQSKVKETLRELNWSYDVNVARIAIGFLNTIADEFNSIKTVMMVNSINKKKTRGEMRELFKKRDAQVLLSEWEITKASKGDDESDEFEYSTDQSEEEYDSETQQS